MTNQINIGDTVYLKHHIELINFNTDLVTIPKHSPVTVIDDMIDGEFLLKYGDELFWQSPTNLSKMPLTPILSDVDFEVGLG